VYLGEDRLNLRLMERRDGYPVARLERVAHESRDIGPQRGINLVERAPGEGAELGRRSNASSMA
jgi:hypothetical protein